MGANRMSENIVGVDRMGENVMGVDQMSEDRLSEEEEIHTPPESP